MAPMDAVRMAQAGSSGKRFREDVAPPGRERQVKELKKQPGVDNPYSVAWASYEKSSDGAQRLTTRRGQILDGCQHADDIAERGGAWTVHRFDRVVSIHRDRAAADAMAATMTRRDREYSRSANGEFASGGGGGGGKSAKVTAALKHIPLARGAGALPGHLGGGGGSKGGGGGQIGKELTAAGTAAGKALKKSPLAHGAALPGGLHAGGGGGTGGGTGGGGAGGGGKSGGGEEPIHQALRAARTHILKREVAHEVQHGEGPHTHESLAQKLGAPKEEVEGAVQHLVGAGTHRVSKSGEIKETPRALKIPKGERHGIASKANNWLAEKIPGAPSSPDRHLGPTARGMLGGAEVGGLIAGLPGAALGSIAGGLVKGISSRIRGGEDARTDAAEAEFLEKVKQKEWTLYHAWESRAVKP